jgi:hypothetical protein
MYKIHSVSGEILVHIKGKVELGEQGVFPRVRDLGDGSVQRKQCVKIPL